MRRSASSQRRPMVSFALVIPRRRTAREITFRMAKRQRTRPGQRRPAARPARPASRPGTPTRPLGGLSEAEESRAAELEAEILAQERAAETTRTRSVERRRTDA